MLPQADLEAFRARLYELLIAINVHLGLAGELADDYRNAPTR